MAMVSTSDIESQEAALINQFHVHMSMRNTTIKQAVDVGAWATKVNTPPHGEPPRLLGRDGQQRNASPIEMFSAKQTGFCGREGGAG